MAQYHKDPEAVSPLSPEQYRVTQCDETEPPFDNTYWDNKELGIYVDVVSGEPLFASFNRFDSDSGWPSFTKPLEPENVIENTDASYGMILRSAPVMATAISAMSSTMVHARRATCATASIPPPCDSFPLMSSRARATAPTASCSMLRRNNHNKEKRNG
jgi:methionine-R-sulfoxide reductase